MSIRLSLYDFFAYTIPGIFYLLIAAFALIAFEFVQLDWQVITDLPLTAVFLFVGAGYVVGILMDVPAYQFHTWFYGTNSVLRERATQCCMITERSRQSISNIPCANCNIKLRRFDIDDLEKLVICGLAFNA